MPSFGIWHLAAFVAFILIVLAFVAVFGRILSRAGYSRWWLLTMFVPLLNLIMVWVFAYADWPVSKPRGQT